MTRKNAFKVSLMLLVLSFGAALLLFRPSPVPDSVDRAAAVRLSLGQDNSRAVVSSSPLPESITGPLVSPVVVDMASLPTGQGTATGMLDRWRAGGLDLDGIEGRLNDAAIRELQEEALKLPPSEQVQMANPAAPTSLSAGMSFASLDYTECCPPGPGGEPSGVVPPDPELAVGPNHIVAVVNTAFEVYNKSGGSLGGPRTFADLFIGVSGCNGADNTLFVKSGLFDPNVLYDESEDRYVIAIDRVRSNISTGAVIGGSHYCLGLSVTNNPVGSWFLYAFPMDSADPGDIWMDYPAAGIGRDAVYLGGNMFTTDLPANINYVESRVWAIRKSHLLLGQATAPVERSVGANFTPQPLHLHGQDQGTWPSGGPHYFFAIDDDVNGSLHRLLSWNSPFANPTPPVSVEAVIDLDVATGGNPGFPVNWPQLGGSVILANDWRPQDFEYRNGYGWTTATVSCNPGSGTVDCVRWAQINLSSGAVVNAGIYASTGNYRTFPDLATNHCNDMAIGYTKGNASSYPGTFVNGREAGDPNGLLQGEQALKAGEITYIAFDSVPRRWGDYTGMTNDPNGETFWYIGQYSKDTGDNNGRWGTYIGSFSFVDCNAAAPTPTPIPGALKVNLPAIIKVPTPAPPPTPTPIPTGPQPGAWEATNTALVFTVSADRENVEDLTFYFVVNDPSCPDVYSATADADIMNFAFEFDGSFYGGGSFGTTTTASGFVGLFDYFVPGCGTVRTSEDVNWTAVWMSASMGETVPDRALLSTAERMP